MNQIRTSVGFIGLGRIGKPMAINLARAGFDLMVYDLREEPVRELSAAGAKVGSSAKEIGEYADIIEIAVVDDAQVESVVLEENGILKAAKPGVVVAIHSTVLPRTIKRVAEQARLKGVCVVDAPVSGGAKGAEHQRLCYMVGGDRIALEKCRPLFATSAANIFHVGELGMGAAAKLAHQLILCINILSAYEGISLAERAGVDCALLQKVVHVSGGQSRVLDDWFQQFKRREASGADRSGFALFDKDLRLALQLGRDLGISLPGAVLTQQLIDGILELEQ